MTYYINPIWFYLINVSIGLKLFLCVSGIASLLVAVFVLISLIVDEGIDITNLENDEKKLIKLFKKIIIVSLISLVIGILVPSEKTCIEMMVASQVTHENVAVTKEEIYEIVDYVTDKVKGEDN